MAYRTSMGSKDRKRRRKHHWEKQGGKCNICKIDISLAEARLDHVIARSKGGKNNLKNTQVLCSFCDNEKGNK
jgi:5-methylcytosine-specific restriction endonuclease McrA